MTTTTFIIVRDVVSLSPSVASSGTHVFSLAAALISRSVHLSRPTVSEEDEVFDEQMMRDGDSSRSQSPSAVKRLSSMDASSLESGVPHELRLVPHTDGPPRLCARVSIASHRKFGPYQAKIRKDPSPTSFNWKVSLISFFSFFFLWIRQLGL
jgi:hypothetical protein